jgi:hypothetical protein
MFFLFSSGPSLTAAIFGRCIPLVIKQGAATTERTPWCRLFVALAIPGSTYNSPSLPFRTSQHRGTQLSRAHDCCRDPEISEI